MADSEIITAEEAEQLRAQRDVALIGLEKMQEAWNDWVNPREYLTDDTSWGLASSSRPISTTSLDDRKDGSFRPVYECEQDLAFIRAAARNLRLSTGVATGALDSLANYTFSGGFMLEAVAENETDMAAVTLAEAIQKAIDEFVDDNDFAGLIDRETDRRAREDGEALLAFDEDEIKAGKVLVEFLEPDQLVEPLNINQLEEWIESWWPSCYWPGVNCWKFGVQTPAGKTWKPLGYHIVRDSRGADWDYYPAHRVEHIKRNVTRNAKRGVSDFLEIAEQLCDEAKLNRNMRRGAALQAAIAWILQAAQGQTQSQVANVGGQQRGQFTLPPTFGSTTTSNTGNAASYPPGTILKVGNGQEYLPGPMGAERNAGFELVGQYVLRAIGTRWTMPEYMISGDSSNGNYSSTLVAGSPFSEARKSDQQFYKRHFLSLIWKVVRIHTESGRFERFGIDRSDFDKLVRFIRIECECPTVDVHDPKIAVETDMILVDAGVMSKQTLANHNNLDYEKEQKLGAIEKPPEPSPFGVPSPFGQKPQAQPPEPGGQQMANDQTKKSAVSAALESVETTDEAKAILREAYP